MIFTTWEICLKSDFRKRKSRHNGILHIVVNAVFSLRKVEIWNTKIH